MTDPMKMDTVDGAERGLLEEQRRRLETLVGELLAANEKLRLKIAELEERTAQAEGGLSQAMRWSGMLL
ncbi:MAG TPA: hypothetical protein VG844_01495 [Terracidiphilus sp.]|nr:hypothetical protein [Terracidiphilus sp.]